MFSSYGQMATGTETNDIAEKLPDAHPKDAMMISYGALHLTCQVTISQSF